MVGSLWRRVLRLFHRERPLPPPRGAVPQRRELPPGARPKTKYELIRERGRNITLRGEVVASKPERRIADFLFKKGVRYEYEFPVEGATPDFYLPDSNILIEHWGMRGTKYLEHRKRKTSLYRSRGYLVVETEHKDVPRLESVLERRLLNADPHVFERGKA